MVKKLLVILLFSYLNSEDLIISNNSILNKKTIKKIEIIGKEVRDKLFINIYLNIEFRYKNSNIKDIKKRLSFFRKYEADILKKLKKPYIIITSSIIDKHINLIFSDKQISKIVDRDSILNSYILPLFVSYDKNSISSKISAGILNGYGEIADNLADNRNIELNSTIRGDIEIFAYAWKYFIYGLVLLGIFAYIFAMFRNRIR